MIFRDKTTEKIQDKTIGLYFSASWCACCHEFTPILKDFYEEVKGNDFEVVFASYDRTEQEMIEYLKDHGDWLYLPFGREQIKLASLTFYFLKVMF